MPLAVAYWLEMDHEAIGLFDRISSIADVHQGQKLESGGHDLVSLALVAIDALVGIEPVVEIPTRVVVEQLRAICQREEVEDAAAFTSNAQRVGRMLASIGFTKGRSHGNARNWIFSRKELDRFAKARGIVFSARLGEKHLADTRSFELPV